MENKPYSSDLIQSLGKWQVEAEENRMKQRAKGINLSHLIIKYSLIGLMGGAAGVYVINRLDQEWNSSLNSYNILPVSKLEEKCNNLENKNE